MMAISADQRANPAVIFPWKVYSQITIHILPSLCLQEDESLMKTLFQQLTDDETDDVARRNLVRFLKEFCTFSSTLQASEREQFYTVSGICVRGVSGCIE